MDHKIITPAWDPTLSKLVTSLKEVSYSTEKNELEFLKTLLRSKELNALVTVHTKIAKISTNDRLVPILSTSAQILLEILEQISQKYQVHRDCKDIFSLLQNPHLQSLLFAHDAIAQKNYYPHLPETPLEINEDEATIKIVQLVKSKEPLGATIKTEEESGKILIARIMHGGAADRSGLITVGDEVIEVNGCNVEGKTPADVLSILQNSEGTITFKLVPTNEKTAQRESKVRVRAYFNYNPELDVYIPCKEAGLAFSRGDILHIVAQDDIYWWQARKETDRASRAGLIPSRALQERRIVHERSQQLQSFDNKISSCTSMCASSDVSKLVSSDSVPNCHEPKTRKVLYDSLENDDFNREMLATYEEVMKLYPRQGIYRPIVLIGAPGVGRNELKRHLIASNPEKFRSPVPYTTRPIRTGEIAGREYIFITKEKMEEEISEGKFIEYGDYKGHSYGTSKESVTSIINAGCICILSPHYQAIKALRTGQLKPFIIHVKPPPFELLKETRKEARAKSTFDKSNSREFMDEELLDMIKSADRIDYMYGHFFDEEITNIYLTETMEKLLDCVQRLEKEPFWAPASWMQ